MNYEINCKCGSKEGILDDCSEDWGCDEDDCVGNHFLRCKGCGMLIETAFQEDRN